MKKYIITGGPHSGKSSILRQLEKLGVPVLHETARLLIMEDQEKKKADPSFKIIYPWDDQSLFCRRCHERQIERERTLTGEFTVMDRSIIDNLAYAKVAGIRLDSRIFGDIEKASYEKKAFFTELLNGYKIDEQRRDSENQVRAVHKELYKIYSRLGFNLITLPVYSEDRNTNIERRTQTLLNEISKEG